MPLFSIIIPVYNKGKSIANTLNSALCQTFTDFEIIIINDGSTDESATEILRIKDPRIRFFETTNQGVSQTRNLAIEKANGTLIAFLDADDYWFPTHLFQIDRLFKQFPTAGLLACNYELFYSEKYIHKPHFIDVPEDNWSGIIVDFFKSSYINRIAWTSAVAVPKKVLEKVGNFSPNITLGAGEDTDLWIRIALQYPVAFDNNITARHNLFAENRMSLTSTSQRKFAKLNEFQEEEKNNFWLKKFLDLYRTEFAIKHKISGDLKTYFEFKNQIDIQNIPVRSKIILFCPRFLLIFLFKTKKMLERNHIYFSIYAQK